MVGHTIIPGIRVHNVGIGPAVKGIIYLCHKEKEERVVEPNEQYTFYGIPSGRSFYFPSNDAPELEKYLKPDTNSLLIRIVHYDLHGNEYHLPKGKKWEEVKLQTVRDWKQKVIGQKDNEEQKVRLILCRKILYWFNFASNQSTFCMLHTLDSVPCQGIKILQYGLLVGIW